MFILVDPYNARENGEDAVESFNSLEHLTSTVKDRSDEYDDEYSRDNWSSELVAYEIARKVPLTISRTTTVSVGEPTFIPAPLPGETVSDYARRLTNG